MLSKIRTAATVILLLLTETLSAQKAFLVSPTHPGPGDTINISYNPDSTILKGLAPVTGVVYLFRDFKWSAQDLDMRMTDSGWSARYIVPADAAFLICNFSAAGKTDKGGMMTYAYMMTASKGGLVAGAYPAWSFIRARSLRREVPDAVDTVASINDGLGLQWLKWESQYHPESRRKMLYNACVFIKKSYGGGADSSLRKQANWVLALPDVTEEEMMAASAVYRNLVGDRKVADSIDNVLVQQYPDGITARDKWIYKMFRESNLRDSMWNEFVVKFPAAKFQDVHTETEDLYYQKVYRSVAYNQIIKHNNYKILEQLVPGAPLYCLTEFHRQVVMNPLEHKNVTPEFILPYSKMILAELELAAKRGKGTEAPFASPRQWEAFVLHATIPAIKGHAEILHMLKDDKQALVYAEKIKDSKGAGDAEFSNLYMQLLDVNGRYAEAVQVAENGVRVNKATPEMITVLKKEYVKKHKSEAGFDAYFQGMKSAEQLSEQQEHLRAALIRQAIPAFRLEQMKGGYADLAKQKGKIVVLDFWATWCGPCKAAMPGMQLAVDKYKKDANVVFYFIATQEHDKDYRDKIKAFIREKGFDMNVLYDSGKQLDDTYAKYAKLMHFSGIPQKMIIDGHGDVRWRSTGYYGSPSALADEIAYVVEMLKKEK